MKQLYIIRGLPGSGKTTFAHKVANVVCEADMFFMKDGIYQYDREKISEAHLACKQMVKGAMLADISTIAVSNTFCKRWEMQDYYDMAATYGYTVTEVTMSGTMRNSIHNVPQEVIDRMKYNWDV